MNISIINKWTKISGWLLINFFYVYYLDPVKVLQKPLRIIVYTQNDINMSEKYL